MRHVAHRIGAGVGLVATSLGATAAGLALNLHDFGDAMVFARPLGAPLYAVFVPSGNQNTDLVILLEMTQGAGTAPGTWQYYLASGSLGAAGNVPGMQYSFEAASNSQSIWAITASVTSGVATQTYWGPIGGGTQGQGSTNSTQVSSSNGEILQQFSYQTVVSSQTCAISFNAYVGTDDFMQYQLANIQSHSASGWNTIMGASSILAAVSSNTASYTITTKSAGAASDTVSGTNFAVDFGGARFQTGSTYALIPTYSFASVSITRAAAPASSFSASLTGTASSGAGVFKTMNTCSAVANSRLALNSWGLIIGGKNGMVRIW